MFENVRRRIHFQGASYCMHPVPWCSWKNASMGVTYFPNVKATSPTNETYCWGNVLGFVTRCHEPPLSPPRKQAGGLFRCFGLVSLWRTWIPSPTHPYACKQKTTNKNDLLLVVFSWVAMPCVSCTQAGQLFLWLYRVGGRSWLQWAI